MTNVVLLVTWMLARAGPGATEKRIPNDSVEVSSRGCIKGRVFATGARTPDEEGTRVGPDISGRSFRLAGPREAMDQVKKYDGQWVEMLGIVKKADLADYTLGTKVGGARVVIGAPRTDPTRTRLPPAPSVPVMDVTAVQLPRRKLPD